jgi:hypothetical protein
VASRYHIVYQGHMLEFQPVPDLKSTANIEPAFCN